MTTRPSASAASASVAFGIDIGGSGMKAAPVNLDDGELAADRFKILTPMPIRMDEGTLIDYTILLHRLPLRWRTRICRWNPPLEFIDEQLKGPYRKWVHHHIFDEVDAGTTRLRDRVKYALPFPPLGELALPLVRAQLHSIFQFRQRTILEIFPHA